MNSNDSVKNSAPVVESQDRKGGFATGMFIGAVGAFIISIIVIGIAGVLIYSAGSSLGLFNGMSADGGKVSAVKAIIQKYYYEDVKDEKLAEGMYRGMVSEATDEYSAYYTSDEYEEEKIESTGNYCGIGASLTQDSKTKAVYVVRVYEGTPAEEAGLKSGDEIISVDGHMAGASPLDKFVQKYLRGEIGTTITMKFLRNNEEQEVEITRREITVPTVDHRMLDKKAGIGLIEIYSFESGTKDDFVEAVDDLKSQGMKAVIYDLRTNPGGLVSSVADILDEILPEGTVVYMLDKQKKKTTFDSDEVQQIKLPTVVLTSENTASSAEIFTGAIRDFNWGTIIGTKTYGKGVVQGVFPLVDGSAVKLTIAKYYTPSGECIDGNGITPDIKLAYKYTGKDTKRYDYSKDNQIKKAVSHLKDQLKQ